MKNILNDIEIGYRYQTLAKLSKLPKPSKPSQLTKPSKPSQLIKPSFCSLLFYILLCRSIA